MADGNITKDATYGAVAPAAGFREGAALDTAPD